MDYTSYTCKQGDRWDTIAYSAYGTVAYMDTIIQANQDVPIDVELDAGVVLKIPILEVIDTISDLLPPWKR